MAELIERARELIIPGGRRLLGISGPPGSGKSTLAEALHAALHAPSILVPMDGFHRSKAELAELGRLDRMGAPDTFDAPGFVELVGRLRVRDGEDVLAPAFDREIEAPVPDAIRVSPAHELVLVEGNYLLLDSEPWSALRSLLDEVWYLEIDPSKRLERLIARHVAYGKDPEAAREWSLGTDEANANLAAGSSRRADLIVCIRE